MKVAYLINQYPKTSHTFVRREIEALEQLGIEVVRFAIRPVNEPLVEPADRIEAERTHALLAEGPGALLAASLGIAIRQPSRFARALILALRLGWGSDRGLPRHFAYLGEACLLLRRLQAHPVEHLHAHFGTNSAAVALLCRALGGPPFSFTVHGPELRHEPQRFGLALKLAHARFVVGVSEDCRARLENWIGQSRSVPVHLVRCGLDSAFLDAEVTPIPSARRLVCVARWSPEKGLPVVLEAARDLARDGSAFELELIGDGELRPMIERMVASFGLVDHVRLMGWRSNAEVRDHLLEARALVLPSLVEGLPVVIMEAYALGRPVIATAVGGVSELVKSDIDGWLVSPGSVPQLAAAMRAALDASPDELARLGRVGRGLVHENHHAAKEAAKLARLFRGEDDRGRDGVG